MTLSCVGRYRWAGGSRRWSRGGLHLFCQSWKKHADKKIHSSASSAALLTAHYDGQADRQSPGIQNCFAARYLHLLCSLHTGPNMHLSSRHYWARTQINYISKSFIIYHFGCLAHKCPHWPGTFHLRIRHHHSIPWFVAFRWPGRLVFTLAGITFFGYPNPNSINSCWKIVILATKLFSVRWNHFLSFFFTLMINIDRLLPNDDKRNACSHFLEAVRSRIIDDIVAVSTKSLKSRQVKRFKNGFLMSQPSSTSDLEYKVISRYLSILSSKDTFLIIAIKAFNFLSNSSPLFILVIGGAFASGYSSYITADTISGHISVFTSSSRYSHHITSLWHSCFFSFLLHRSYYWPY